MFKYLWIIILVAIWLIWLIVTVVDVVDTYQVFGFRSDFWDYLDDYSKTFITLTFVIIFAASIVSWFLSLM